MNKFKRQINSNVNRNSDQKGQGKLMDLKEAVRRYVRPGIKLHMAGGFGGPCAAICEIIRQYWGKHPDLTLIQSTISGHALNLVYCNLLKKLICSACVDMSESSRPSRIVRTALREGRIEMENWSLCSLQQRLMAGAFGVPFMPTRSVSGSNIATDNRGCFREIDDPFNSQKKAGVVKALNPDISIVHACAADPEGNTILSAPYGDDIWGSLASTGGIVVTAEKIVSQDFIKKYSALVKIPGSTVNAVVHTPMGAHPFPFTNPGIDGFDPYEMDIDFLNKLHTVSGNNGTLDSWINEWVLTCSDHNHYLEKIGERRITELKHRENMVLSWEVPPSEVESFLTDERVDAEEFVLIVIAREIIKSIQKSGHKMILVGAGSRTIAAWLAYDVLKSEGHELNLITGNGQIGYIPQSAGSILPGQSSVNSTKMLTDTITTHAVFVGGRNNKCLSVLGAGQIDRFGNINSTKTSKGEFLVGSGGANDSVNSREVIIILNQSRDRFAEKLSFITSIGDNVTTVVSTMGVFRKSAQDGELYLTECFPTPEDTSLDQKIEKIRENCGWQLKTAPDVKVIPGATNEEARLIKSLMASFKSGRTK